jgi:hypothetical protein
LGFVRDLRDAPRGIEAERYRHAVTAGRIVRMPFGIERLKSSRAGRIRRKAQQGFRI